MQDGTVDEIIRDLKRALKSDNLEGEVRKIIRQYGKKKRKRGDFEIRVGNSYYVDESKPKISLKIFEQILDKDYNGLCITRTNPDNFELGKKFDNVDFYWLSSMKSPKCLSPGDLPSIFAKINEFLHNHKKAVVFMDGIDTLVINNDFSKVLKFIQSTKDVISERKGILILSINLNSLEERQCAMLKSEFIEIPQKK